MTTKAIIPKIPIKTGDVVTDLFCGGGGTTTGAKKALERLGYKFWMCAINHWNLAIETHQINHPDVVHYCQSIDTILPQEIIPGRKLKLLLASPECTDHSNAKGGKPRSDQKRADAWLLMRWIEKLDVDTLVVENVKEFTAWGPLNKKGLPDKRRRGEYFRAFINILEINYSVQWRILNAADYGDATSRERFILIAKKGKNRKIEFPEPTHASRKILEKAQPDMFNPNLKPWRAAAEIIEWDRKGKSIFGRKNPLSPNTMKRIYAGLRKYSGIDLPDREVFLVKSLFSFLPKDKRAKVSMLFADQFETKLERNKHFIVPLWECVIRNDKGKVIGHYQYPSKEELERRRATKQAEVDRIVRQTPIKIDWTKCRTFTPPVKDNQQSANPEPFTVNLKSSDRRMRSISEPTFTQTSGGNHQFICEPVVTNLSHTRNNDETMCRSSEEPLPVICGKGMLGLIESLPFMVQSYGEREGQLPRTRDISEPTWTITPQVRMNLVEPCLVKYYLGSDAVSVREPVPTITANYEHIALAESFIASYHGGEGGENRNHSTGEPLPTVDTSNRFALVEPFLVLFRRNQGAQTIAEPLKTLTTKDAYGLVEVQIVADEKSPIPINEVGLYIPYLGVILFIRFRMLAESELARAMGFPENYQFAGTRQDRVTQIGNAVPCGLSEAVVYAAMKDSTPPKRKAAKAAA